MGGWSEDWRVMLNSTQDQIKLMLKFELSLAVLFLVSNLPSSWSKFSTMPCRNRPIRLNDLGSNNNSVTIFHKVFITFRRPWSLSR